MTTSHHRNYQSSPPPDPLEADLLQIEETNKLLSNLETKISNLVGHKNASPPLRSSTDTNPTPYRNLPNPYRAEVKTPQNPSVSPQNFRGARRSVTGRYDSNSKNEKRHINIVEDEDIPRVMPSHLYSSPAHISSLYGTSPIKNDDFHEINRQDFKNSFKLRDEESQNNDRSGFIREPIETFGLMNKEDKIESIREGIRQRNLKRPRDGFLDKMGQMEKFYKEKIDILEEKLMVYEDEVTGNAQLVEDLKKEVERLKSTLEESRKTQLGYEDMAIKWAAKEQELNKEKRGLEREIEQIKKAHKESITEKEDLERRYEGLLKVQREMVQLDMERNEKSLKNSAAKMEERSIMENEKILGLLETLEQYKEEVECLKENNNLIRKQLGFEVEQLKEELAEQKMENRRLSRRAKNESITSQSSEYKREGSKKREEEIRGTGSKEGGNYVKEWGNYYPHDEGKTVKSLHHRGKSSLSRRNEEGLRRFEEREKEDIGNDSFERKGGARRERK